MRKDDHNPYEERRHPVRALMTALILALIAILIYWKWEDISNLSFGENTEEWEEGASEPEEMQALENTTGHTDRWQTEDGQFVVVEMGGDEIESNEGDGAQTPETATAHEPVRNEKPISAASPKPVKETGSKPATETAEKTGPRKIKVRAFREDGKVGFKDADGNVVIVPQYERESYRGTDPVSFVVVMQGGKYGIVSLENTVLVPFLYDGIHDIPKSGGYMKLTNLDPTRYGILRTSDMEVVLPVEYSGMTITWPIIAVGKDNLWGTVDAENRTIIPLQYKSNPGFSTQGDKVEVWFRDDSGRIITYDKNGKVVEIEE